MHESSLVLKQDTMGRVRATAERRLAVLAEFRRSGLSGYRFARLAGMKYPTLMAWVRQAGGASRPVIMKGPAKGKAVLVEAVVRGPAQTAPQLVVHLGGGVRLELTDGGQLALAAQLIQALQRPC